MVVDSRDSQKQEESKEKPDVSRYKTMLPKKNYMEDIKEQDSEAEQASKPPQQT